MFPLLSCCTFLPFFMPGNDNSCSEQNYRFWGVSVCKHREVFLQSPQQRWNSVQKGTRDTE